MQINIMNLLVFLYSRRCRDTCSVLWWNWRDRDVLKMHRFQEI